MSGNAPEVHLDEAALKRVRSAVAALAERLDLADQVRSFLAHSWDGGNVELPILCLDDVSAIPFLMDIVGVQDYQHRARVRARDGDLFAAVTPLTPGYEEYCQGRLQMPPAELVMAVPVDGPLAVTRACKKGAAFARLVERTRAASGLVIHPYMAIEDVWELAGRLHRETEAPVAVIGSPPPVTWLANDKGLFGEVVDSVLGGEYLVETHSSNRPAALAGLLLDLAERHRQVALKRVRCASAMGNVVYEARTVQEKGPSGVEGDVRGFLERTEWDGEEWVLAVAWEGTEVSPSTQLWIPPLGSGPPRLDGIYEQILMGEEKIFVGSRPSTLPAPVNRELAASALHVAAGLQALGYVGRCSFDHLVLGDPEGDFLVRFTECNGRWGGTSTPMSLVDRLVPGPRPPYRAQDFVDSGLVGASFIDLLSRVGEEAYNARKGSGRFIFYNVGPLERYGKFDVIALARTQEEAEAAMEEDLPRLLGI